jgi:hypothetical protein
MPFGGITDGEMRTMAAELSARVADTGDPFSGDDWSLFQIAKAVPALMDANADLIAACEKAEGFVKYALEFWDWTRFPNLEESAQLLQTQLREAVAKAKGGAA